ncbi:hypothetical protein P879_08984 [Paragonimus westermani]|uniref:Uncharacterized protein n=1 Tax=Paragonimus westermani TaxID=34504 RepID=A0A8T0DAJ4_9TREM|nr:hypothetical protein P879_08984 [Paragonimus westermani]
MSRPVCSTHRGYVDEIERVVPGDIKLNAALAYTEVNGRCKDGMYQCLFHVNYMITHHEDCSNSFARGNITIGEKMIDKVRGWWNTVNP